MCTRYTNEHGTSFLNCDEYVFGDYRPAYLLTLGIRDHYPRTIKYCPLCGKKLKVKDLYTDKQENNILWRCAMNKCDFCRDYLNCPSDHFRSCIDNDYLHYVSDLDSYKCHHYECYNYGCGAMSEIVSAYPVTHCPICGSAKIKRVKSF